MIHDALPIYFLKLNNPFLEILLLFNILNYKYDKPEDEYTEADHSVGHEGSNRHHVHQLRQIEQQGHQGGQCAYNC